MSNKFINDNSNSNETNDVHNEYSDHIYVGESKSKEVLFDRNNPIIKAILFLLGSVAVIGTLYYILQALQTM